MNLLANNISRFLITVVVILIWGCRKNEYNPPSDPKKAILGKWELVELGNWPIMEPYQTSEYIEFLRDSLIGIYDYKTKEYRYAAEKYWIDSLLHQGVRLSDSVMIAITYKYKFYDDKLKLDMNADAIYVTSIFKRIK